MYVDLTMPTNKSYSRNYWFWLLLATGLTFGSGCFPFPNQFEEKVIYINHAQGECRGMAGYFLCMLSKKSQSGAYSGEYHYIKGFEYEWGFNYKLLIEVETYPDNVGVSDSPSEKYKLLKQKDKKLEPVTTLFDISVSEPMWLTLQASGTEYSIYNDKTFTCNPTDCATIDSNITLDNAMLFEFTHNVDPTKPLNLVRIKCSAPAADFYDLCLK